MIQMGPPLFGGEDVLDPGTHPGASGVAATDVGRHRLVRSSVLYSPISTSCPATKAPCAGDSGDIGLRQSSKLLAELVSE
jgi:hypothetical protein